MYLNKVHFKRNVLRIIFIVIVLSLAISLFPIKAFAESINMISNPSVESVSSDPNFPVDWNQGSWGNNTPVYEYSNDGYDGARSLKVTMTNYTNGDAKWYFPHVSVNASSSYVYTDYYKSDVPTDVVAEITTTANAAVYQWLGTASASSTWNRYNTTFTTPSNAKDITILHVISSNGYLQTDNFSLTTPQTATVTNGVPNNSLETPSDSNPNMPASWNQGNWGNNTPVYSYLNTGHTGNKSVRIDMNSYSSGDAKWYYNAQSLTSSKQYTFTDYYMSNVATEVVAEVVSTSNTYSYISVATLSPASTWTQASGNFTTPANTKTVSVFHLINKVGFLTTDDYSINEAVASIFTGVPNDSVEKVNPSNANLPVSWNQSGWGNNTTVYTYANSGHTGSRSVKVEITSYTDGDAKWAFDAQTVTPSTDYQFSDYYISNVDSSIVAEVQNKDNTYSYITLGLLSPATDWTQAKVVFSAPTTAKAVSIFHLINRVGYLSTDDFALHTYSRTGFNQAIVSVNFDDGWKNIYTNGIPVLDKYGIKSTQYIISGYIGTTGYVTKAQVKAMDAAGHEIGSHTVDHPDLTTLTTAQITTELSQSKQTLETLLGKPVIDFAAPYGTYNDEIINIAKNYYQSYRTTDAGFMFKTDYDIYRIKTQNIESTTTVAQVKAWIDQAIKDKTWLILVYHEVNNSGSQYSTKAASLDSEMSYLKNTGVKVSTMSDAINAVKGQL